ncbi:MAG: CinA family nicotinamide mononucleotide deamidase-related protein [Nitriliruptoraceae bacterium]
MSSEVAAITPTAAPVTAAILSVGSELLLGDLTDSNATWLSRRLRELGVDVVHHVAARDELDELVDALGYLVERVDVILVGGGLGPTVDDLTREAIAAAAGVALEEHDDLREAIIARFATMGRTMSAQNLKQARIPAGAQIFPAVGTAPAFALTLDTARVIALPGVPWEMRALFDRHVVAEVQRLAGPRATVTRSVHVAGRGESDVAAVVEPLIEDFDGVTLAFLAHSRAIEVRLTRTAGDPDSARAELQPAVDAVVAALGSSVAAIDDESLEDTVIRLLVEREQTVATAESATAGDIASRLGRVPGASRALLGGVVVYATATKRDLLGIDASLLDTDGPISPAVTTALASAVRARTGAAWAIAVTGVAGPEPVGARPVGTAIWALAHPDGHVEVHERVLSGDRDQIIARLGTSVLDLLRRRLAEA